MNAELDAVRGARHQQARQTIPTARPKIFPRVDAEQAPPEQLEALLAGAYEFNGERHVLGLEPDWRTNPSADIEWQILLHKFYYAPALVEAADRSGDRRYFERWLALTASWLRADLPTGFIATDVAGRRVQNWIYALYLAEGSRFARLLSASLRTSIVDSLVRQTDYLCANLTPKRNHRTLELHAIVLAGVALRDVPRAIVWRDFAVAETVANMRADLLADGVHCELSTDYHHLALRNFLSIRQLLAANGGVVLPEMDALLERALEFSLHAHNPGGIVPSFSDGDARGYLDLLAQGAEIYGREDFRYVATGGREGTAPLQRVVSFPASGYAILRSGWGSDQRAFRDEHHVVFDCGPLGEGNHGHLDCLSFELFARGRRLIADPGRYTYSEAGDVNWRARFRGTAAHNTVTVDGRHQTRYAPKPAPAGGRHPPGQLRHRVLGPAPATELHAVAAGPGYGLLAGSALSAEYPVRHDRWIVSIDDRFWLIVDRLRADDAHRYQARLQIAPEAAHDDNWKILTLPGAEFTAEDGWVSDRYGEKRAAPQLVLTTEACEAWLVALIDTAADQGGNVLLSRLDGGETCTASIGLGVELRVGTPTLPARRHELWFEQPNHGQPARCRAVSYGAAGEKIGCWEAP